MNIFQYVPMLYRGAFESYAAAMASMGKTDEEIVQFLEGAKAAGQGLSLWAGYRWGK